VKMRRLTNAEFERAEALARAAGVPLNHCPTCLAKPIEIAPDVWVFINGQYKLYGETYDCDCDTQIALRKHYLLANIGDQYQRLNWADYKGQQDVRDLVESYLEKWPSFKQNGMGLEFNSSKLGVGKTFAATYVGKELIKRGELVYFMPFLEVISLYESADREELEHKLRDTTVLILDEVRPPYTDAQKSLFSTKFEELIRHRTNFNRITVMTTNLPPDKLHDTYPRTYSLLEAKQVRVEMDGTDARQGFIASENLELAWNGEIKPIT
jgi:DNA replication protein DnaC